MYVDGETNELSFGVIHEIFEDFDEKHSAHVGFTPCHFLSCLFPVVPSCALRCFPLLVRSQIAVLFVVLNPVTDI